MTRRSVTGLVRRSSGRARLCALALGITCGRTNGALADERASEVAREAQLGRVEALAAGAFEAYRHEQYAKAIALYLDAYAIYPAADILFNIARIYDLRASDPAQARRFYRAYIEHPEADVERIAIASERLQQFAPEAAPSHEPPTSRSAGPLPLDSAADEASSWSPSKRAALVASGAGLAAITVGVGFGVAALSDAAIARRSCNGNLCESQRGIQAVRSASRSADIASLGFVVGGALLAGGLVVLALSSDEPASQATEAEAELRLRPVARASRLGLELTGTW
jgi:hypothetical protein